MKKEFPNILLKDLPQVAKFINNLTEEFFKRHRRACVIFLKGELGAGKTTLTKELGEIREIKEDISSPTFVLRRDYDKLIHIDGYRFERAEEGKDLYLERELDKEGQVIVVEWGERFAEAIDLKPDILVELLDMGENLRNISVSQKFE